jgi:ABC-type multidrug transport system ATPase subunit
MVGNEIVRGISGGERKRLNIATELVTDPSLIFLDEPTTGLDSFAAQSTMQMLLNLAKNSRTVVATIHQPRSSIFGLFDMLFLISEGRSMYFGAASEAVPYFATLGYRCPQTFNPADFFIDLFSVDQRLPVLEKESRGRIAAIGDAHKARSDVKELRRVTMASLRGLPADTTINDPTLSTASAALVSPNKQEAVFDVAGRKYATSWFTQFGYLTKRAYWSL